MTGDTELVIASMAPGTDIEANFDALKAHIAGILANYQDVSITAADVPVAKKHRAYLNGLSKSLNQRRIDVKNQYMRPVVVFEEKVKELDAPIKATSAAIDEQVKAYEAEAKTAKRKELMDHWEAYAGALADAVPFELVENPAWMNASTNLMAAFAEIETAVDRIATEEATLTELNLSHSVEAKAEYFATLDMSKAIARSKALDMQEERARQVEEAKAEAAKLREQLASDPPASPMPPIEDSPQEVEPQLSWRLTFTCSEATLGTILGFLQGLGITGKAVREWRGEDA